jgi:peptidoglycan/LPS O-acetylase OafA/YrhL
MVRAMVPGSPISTAAPAAPAAVPDAVGSPALYRPELDVLRLFAFLCIFAVHKWPALPAHPRLAEAGTALIFGVQLFFLLSAFLITC